MEEDSQHQLSCSTANENPLQTTISVEMEVPLCDRSRKRLSQEMDGEKDEKRKAMKKRRSSLSTKRRSIIGDQHFPLIDPVSDSASQSSSASGGDPPSSSSQDDRLKPNPANLKMETVIKLIEGQIKSLDNEYKEWQELLETFVKKEEESSQLLSNLKLPMSCIPEDIKQLGQSQYIKVKPLNLADAKSKVTNIISQYQFDREACCQDLRLIKSTVETVQFSNKTLADHLQQALEERRRENESDSNEENSQASLQGKGKSDTKEAVAKLILNY